MRCLRLLSRPCGSAIAEIIHLLRTQWTARVNGLNGPSLLGKRRLHGHGWSLIDERPRLIGWAWSRSLDLGRSNLRVDGRRRYSITARGFKLLHRPRRYGLRGCRGPRRGGFRSRPVVGRRRRCGSRMHHGCRSDHLRLALLREPGAIHRLRRHRTGTVHRGGRRQGCADWRSRRSGALKTLSGFDHGASLDRRNSPGGRLHRDDRRRRSD